MTHTPFPTVAAYPLPASLAALPITAPEKPDTENTTQEPDSGRDDLVQAVSDAIARRARQRRYTP